MSVKYLFLLIKSKLQDMVFFDFTPNMLVVILFDLDLKFMPTNMLGSVGFY